MKKYYLVLLLLFLPFTVSAKEYCNVISGDGLHAGSEIVCGTEHFNIVDTSDNQIRMLAKYNLLVGETIYKEKIEDGYTGSEEDYCNSLAYGRGGTVRSDVFYNAPGYCFYTISIGMKTHVDTLFPATYDESAAKEQCESYSNEERNCFASRMYGGSTSSGTPGYFYGEYLCYCNTKDYNIQNEEAISAHWDDEDNFLYPQVADTYVSGYVELDTISVPADFVLVDNSSTKYDGYFWDLSVRNNSNFYYYLYNYSAVLRNNGFDIQNIDFITLDDINNIIKGNSKTLSYEDLYNASLNAVPPRYEFAFLQDYLMKQQEFIFNTTYWVRTGYNKVYDDSLGVANVVFIDERGGICGSAVSRTSASIYNSGNCSYKIENYLKSSVGTGIRPVVTINKSDVIYQIQTDVNDNGEIEVIENSMSGEVISFKATPKPGYKLASLVIKRANGEEIEISPDDLIENEDGTVTLLESFTMPAENVVIYARWVSIYDFNNPTTGSIFLLFILLIVFTGLVFLKRKKQRV